jgi:hypothetical protein
METIPAPWRGRLGLLQNELLPRDWEAYGLAQPTVISVWFEKKKEMDSHALLPSPVYGPNAALIADALAGLEIPAKILSSEDELIFELVLKNVFVLTINIAGLVLEPDATTAMLWRNHRKLALDVAEDVIKVQEFLAGKAFSRDRLRKGFLAGINGDPNHKCRGRSAPGRLERVVELADEAGLEIKVVKDIQQLLRS